MDPYVIDMLIFLLPFIVLVYTVIFLLRWKARRQDKLIKLLAIIPLVAIILFTIGHIVLYEHSWSYTGLIATFIGCLVVGWIAWRIQRTAEGG